jgi:hypothetical protein
MDYERAGVAETYRRVRTLPAETLTLWRELLVELVPSARMPALADRAAAVDVAFLSMMSTGVPLHEQVDVFVFRR